VNTSCKGCRDNGIECWISNMKNCPCSICLIKTMCKIPCKAYNDFEVKQYKQQAGSFHI